MIFQTMNRNEQFQWYQSKTKTKLKKDRKIHRNIHIYLLIE